MDPPDPIEAIKYRMEGIIGTRTWTAEVLSRKRGLSIAMIRCTSALASRQRC
jgi:antitoxin component HigA of HigAB toxin-antitoxin module